MPKELSHLIFSDRALNIIEKTCPEKGTILRTHYDLYLLGSIIPDTAFYDLPLFMKNKSISFLSHRVHTNRGGLDKVFLTRALEEGISGSDENFAFCCGLISHQWADSLFHPFIVYFTGNYFHPDLAERKRAQARHRFLEGLVDLKLMAHYFPQGEFSPASVTGRLKAMKPPPSCLSLFVRSVPAQDEKRRTEEMVLRLDKARLFQLRLLSLYGNNFFRQFILLVNRLSGNRFEDHAALLYGDKASLSLNILNEECHFKDPWSGQAMKGSITGLAKEVLHNLTGSIKTYGEARKYSRPFLPADLFVACGEDKGDEALEDCLDTGEMDKFLKRFLNLKG
ncbi:MAG: zinc dependent phospholipase C family protein [Deltaproteobacteria bacterium]|nr:zinc dependent phospholipase C family protein [Deltaproteobacteria bacterium]